MFHELSAYLDYMEPDGHLTCLQLAGGTELDFVPDDVRLAVEAEGSEQISSSHLKELRRLARVHSHATRRVVACLEPQARRT